MAGSDILGTVGAGAGRIGRYFTVVSALPAAVFVAYVYLLVKTGAWSGHVRWSVVTHLAISDVAVLGVASFVLALTMNPLQFALIQLFEGYWGTSALAEHIAVLRIAYHQQRLIRLQRAEQGTVDRHRRAPFVRGRPQTDPLQALRRQVRAAESRRASDSYPKDLSEVLPTRLGNVLRRYETSAGMQYELDLLSNVPRLAMVAAAQDVAYVENQRVQLELALRTSFLALMAACVTVVVLWRDGAWLLIALVPYAVAYLSYRGAVAVAHEYGTSLAVLLDLNRFALYDRLRVEPPADIDDERRLNRELTRLFGGQRNDRLVRYRSQPANPPPAPDTGVVEQPDGDAG